MGEVAGVLGFEVIGARLFRGAANNAHGFWRYLQHFVPEALTRVKQGVPVDLVLANSSALPPWSSSYWLVRVVPHLVSVDGDEAFPEPAPAHWREYRLSLPHGSFGGSTDGLVRLACLVPTQMATACAMRHRFPEQEWSALSGVLEPTTPAPRDFPEVEPTVRPGQLHVVWSQGAIMPWGGFPASAKEAVVKVPCVYNVPGGWGRRPLTPTELAKLWDVPLSVVRWAAEHDELRLLNAFTMSTPGKGLVLGGDYLLASCVRGG